MKRIYLLIIFILPLIVSAQGVNKSGTAEEALLLKDYPGAVGICQSILKENPDDSGARNFLALALISMQDYSGALEAINGMATDNINKEAAFIRAECLEALGDTRAAKSIYSDLYSGDSTDINALRHLSRLAIKNGDYNLAADGYGKLVSLFPDNYLFRKNMGIACYNLNREFEALENLREAWELNRLDINLPVNIANVYARLQESSNAIDILKEGLGYDSLNIPILKTLGYINYRMEEWDSSSFYFGRAMFAGDSSTFTNKHLGISLFNLNNIEEAIPPLRLFYDDDTLNSEATYYLGLALSSWYNKTEGIELLNRTISLMSPDTIFLASVHASIGLSWNDINNYGPALESYLRASELDPARPSYFYETARVYDRLGTMQKSVVYYKKAIETYNHFLELQLAEMERVRLERGLERDQVSAPGIDFARDRIEKINKEIFFLGGKNN